MQSRRLSSRCSPPLFRVFSGIQPTGSVHLGNYLGAVRRWVELQSQPHSSGQPEPIVLSVVDLHAITVRKAAEEVRGGAQNVLATLLACGIDPGKCLVFQQSAVPHHAELSWILSCLVSYNKLKTMTHFKMKAVQQRETVSLGLYCYPVLMAADVLLYKATHVPVGNDQTQHMELMRGQLPRVLSLRNASEKMSKSATDDLSRINLEDSADSIRDKISRAKTDSMDHISFDPENRPEISNLISIFSSITGNDPENISSSYQGNKLTKKFKEDLADALIEHIIPIQKELSRLKADPSYLSQILCEGNARASKIAQSTMQEVREAVGLCSPSPL